ncbi:hypothetical protein ACOUGK_17850 [Acinetobacter baumannii]|uniref:Uncharacterized protein n=1 Tax=Acinetobacter baumannii (strain SDF) TaxID=509170 RepID=B0VKG1_ACIBS|nr:MULTISPECIES: hypothetical protein [Acinetobacter]PXA49463.1 hypothetical protein DMB35_20710 [Acinetobacter baumannii A424]CAP00664.1 hypothetical protein ABSDF1318 [Acinetobacter baumannii SDF]ENV02076.1 hypothetical protein F968_02663 [Acinetobacter sp. NIPH 817]MBC6816252.1 hypothetical protein [Acinetobacter baumannii]MBD0074997.1 hypothetical protein [Acinetobacter baumannii]
MFGKILNKFKAWYKGDPGDMRWDPRTDTYVGTREPSKHWTAKVLSYFVDFSLLIAKSIKKHPSAYITQLLAFIAILVSCFSIYLQYYVDDDEYKRCTIAHTNNQEIALKCKK